jgi:hypothetical protein
MSLRLGGPKSFRAEETMTEYEFTLKFVLPDKQPEATAKLMAQAELLADTWALEAA